MVLEKNWKNSVFNFGLRRIISKGKTTDIAVNSSGRRINNLESLDPYFSKNPPIEINVKSKADPRDTVYVLLIEIASLVEKGSSLANFSL